MGFTVIAMLCTGFWLYLLLSLCYPDLFSKYRILTDFLKVLVEKSLTTTGTPYYIILFPYLNIFRYTFSTDNMITQ